MVKKPIHQLNQVILRMIHLLILVIHFHKWPGTKGSSMSQKRPGSVLKATVDGWRPESCGREEELGAIDMPCFVSPKNEMTWNQLEIIESAKNHFTKHTSSNDFGL